MQELGEVGAQDLHRQREVAPLLRVEQQHQQPDLHASNAFIRTVIRRASKDLVLQLM